MPAINRRCPRSGRTVADDSLASYRGHVVGFCNPHCRDDFAAHVDDRPRDRAYFDALIAEQAANLPDNCATRATETRVPASTEPARAANRGIADAAIGEPASVGRSGHATRPDAGAHPSERGP